MSLYCTPFIRSLALLYTLSSHHLTLKHTALNVYSLFIGLRLNGLEIWRRRPLAGRITRSHRRPHHKRSIREDDADDKNERRAAGGQTDDQRGRAALGGGGREDLAVSASCFISSSALF